MNILPTNIAGVSVVQTKVHTDSRGAFMRCFCENEFAPVLESRRIVQINHSRTTVPGTVRGLHFQKAPYAEMKIIRCLRGAVWDVAVDLRTDSATYGKWHAEILSADSANMLIIPEGCAHGFQSLEQDSELLYLHTAPYTPAAESGVAYNDTTLNIPWRSPVADISLRDRTLPTLASGTITFTL